MARAARAEAASASRVSWACVSEGGLVSAPMNLYVPMLHPVLATGQSKAALEEVEGKEYLALEEAETAAELGFDACSARNANARGSPSTAVDGLVEAEVVLQVASDDGGGCVVGALEASEAAVVEAQHDGRYCCGPSYDLSYSQSLTKVSAWASEGVQGNSGRLRNPHQRH